MDLSVYFKLIAAKAEIMETKCQSCYASDIHQFVSEIREQLKEIEQEAIRRDPGDR